MLVALTLAATMVRAQPTTLEQFVADVVKTNPVVREQVHVYRQVLQDYQIALAGWRPSLDVTAGVGGISRKAPNTVQERREYGSYDADVRLTQNIFNGFDTTFQIEQSRARITAEAFRLYDTADNVALEAIRTFNDVLDQRRQVEIAAQNVESHERILAQIRELGARGITRRSDIEQTEGRLARANASLVAQQNNLQDALSALHRLLGRYLSAQDLMESDAPPRPEGDFEELTGQALAVHPAMESARNNIAAAKADYQRSRRTDYPNIDLQLRQNLGNDVDGPFGNTNERSVFMNFSYNLYRGGADQAAQRQKASAVQENRAFLDRVRRQVVDNLRLAWTADQALEVQLPYLRQHTERSLETVELYGEEYFLQKRNLIDVLNAEGELNRALAAEASAGYDARTARYRVYEGMGKLFDVLDLEVEITDTRLRIASIEADGIDTDVLTIDRDADGLEDDLDQCDNTGASASADRFGCDRQPELTLGYDPADRTFDAVDDELSVAAGEVLVIAPAALFVNDYFSVLEEPRIRRFSQPVGGRIDKDAEGNLIYTPSPGFVGEDGFTYTVGDRRGRFATANVVIRVGLDAPAPADAAGAVDPVAAVDPGVEGLSVDVVRFGYKQLTLTPDSEDRVDAAVERLLRYPEVPVEVLAYTDNVGSARYNLKLSKQRADALKEILVERGITPERIEAVGLGENNPIADNSTDEGRALNRRAELRYRIPAEN